jgi:hypothetical protein
MNSHKFKNIAMIGIRARFYRGADDTPLKIAKFRRSVLGDDIEFLNRVRRWSETDGVFRNLIVVHTVEKEVV